MKIQIKAIGVNRADVFFLEGKYPVFGIECAGLDEKGRRVAAIVDGGAYADEVEADASGIIELPKKMTFEEGASLIEALFTTYYNLVDLCKLKKGEKVLIHGGGSSIGVVGIQLAKLLGAEVYATAGHKRKFKVIKDLGATPINYRSEDFTKYNYDVILDIVGADYFARNISALNKGGRLAIISFISGAKVSEVNLGPLLTKSLSVFGSTVGGLSKEKRAEIKKEIIPYFTKIKPVIDKTFPFAQKSKALEYVRDYKNVGKVVVTL